MTHFQIAVEAYCTPTYRFWQDYVHYLAGHTWSFHVWVGWGTGEWMVSQIWVWICCQLLSVFSQCSLSHISLKNPTCSVMNILYSKYFKTVYAFFCHGTGKVFAAVWSRWWICRERICTIRKWPFIFHIRLDDQVWWFHFMKLAHRFFWFVYSSFRPIE